MKDKTPVPFNAMEQHSSERPHRPPRDADAEAEQRALPPLVDLHRRMGNGAIQLMSRRAMHNHTSHDTRAQLEADALGELEKDLKVEDGFAPEVSNDRDNILAIIADEMAARYG